MTFGVDYAWAPHPSISALKNAGVRFVCRYLSPDSSKNLSPSEARALSDAGIDIVVVWESTANRAIEGHAAGAQDARDADAQAKACGMPAGRPIYFAVDFDATGQTGAVNTYLDGAASVLGVDRVGIYGGYAAVHSALNGGHAKWAWATYAWSGGNWDPRDHIEQYSNDHIIGGVGLDYDRAMKTDFGQWRVGVSPQPQLQEDDDMLGQLNTGNGAVTPLSWPQGKAKAIGFFADTGLVKAAPIGLRVAYHKGGGNYVVKHIKVDSATGKTVVDFGADAPNVDAVSVQREDDALTPVSWDAS